MPSADVINALETLRFELEKLKPAITLVETSSSVLREIQQLPSKHEKFISSVTASDKNFKASLTEFFRSNLADLSNENDALQKSTISIQKASLDVINELKELTKRVENYYNQIDVVNFPSRLEKIDAIVLSAMLAVQSLQSRHDNFERTLLDSMRVLESEFKRSSKIQQNREFFTWGLILLVGLSLFFFKH